MTCDHDSSRLYVSVSKQRINAYLSSYTNNFEQPLVLNEEYDVGLAEIQYPQSKGSFFRLRKRNGSHFRDINLFLEHAFLLP